MSNFKSVFLINKCGRSIRKVVEPKPDSSAEELDSFKSDLRYSLNMVLYNISKYKGLHRYKKLLKKYNCTEEFRVMLDIQNFLESLPQDRLNET